MSNQPLDQASAGKANDFVRLAAGAVAGGFSSYLLTQLSLHGVDFRELGIDSEIVKSTITGFLVGIVVAPRNIIFTLRDSILFCRFACKVLWDAIMGKKDD